MFFRTRERLTAVSGLYLTSVQHLKCRAILLQLPRYVCMYAPQVLLFLAAGFTGQQFGGQSIAMANYLPH